MNKEQRIRLNEREIKNLKREVEELRDITMFYDFSSFEPLTMEDLIVRHSRLSEKVTLLAKKLGYEINLITRPDNYRVEKLKPEKGSKK